MSDVLGGGFGGDGRYVGDGLCDRAAETRISSMERIEVATDLLMTLAAAKLYLKVDHDAEDELITDLIRDAQSYIEDYTNTAIAAQTWVFVITGEDGYLPLPVDLPRPPFRELIEVKRTDVLGFEDDVPLNTLSVRGFKPGSLRAIGRQWILGDELIVTVKTGYTDLNAAPPVFRQALKLLIGHWYENREASTPANRDLRTPVFSVHELLDTQRVRRL